LSARVDRSDVVQEALTQAFQSLNQFRGRTEEEWVGWLHSIVTGHAGKIRRHHRAEKRDAGCDQTMPPAGLADLAAGPVSCALEREQTLRLAAAVEDLPDPMREVIVRRVFHQEPFDVVAGDMNRSPGAARVLWTRAIRQLRQTLANS
jgi:RNA polymerase sigma-70 factor (ECF subfamily)